MNLVVISAALSSANSNLYSTTRMLFSLSRAGYVPGWVSRVSAAGVPRRALAVASGGMVVAILLAVFCRIARFWRSSGRPWPACCSSGSWCC